ncbi:class I SAM-dependent methyltransferase [Pyxidicoccus xibeiensis]|uniref:class I SAM-dependent methyltransferase n=1 Tax=Pyxidicoccus xibeiensis TaxID=2906759 RepID=UPI0020A7158C|nr:class I SAM-dependent methyltransferase [Pyxidicoccus xibeiensis]MCP3139551.1 class I SAM-dependent methyltransferase [Pyxidicoccus xibeiensis]
MSANPKAYDQRYTAYQLQRSLLRKWVRGFYLRSAAALVEGPTIDFGCGVGEFLARLPAGSVGLEINQASVDHCRGQGLDVLFYDASTDDWSLSQLVESGRRFKSIAISHVLEHLDEPVRSLNSLLKAAERLGIERALVIVPGRKGFASDATHRTFVDLQMLSAPEAVAGTRFELTSRHHFPLDVESLGGVFTHHELRVVFARAPQGPGR